MGCSFERKKFTAIGKTFKKNHMLCLKKSNKI